MYRVCLCLLIRHQDDVVYAATSPTGEPLVLKWPMGNATHEYRMLLAVQAYPQYYVHLRTSFRDKEGREWLEMDRLPGSGMGKLADSKALQRAFRALLTVPMLQKCNRCAQTYHRLSTTCTP